MRKLVALPGAVVVAMAVAVAPAAAQDDKPVTKFVSKAKIVPKKAGTKKNPRGHKIVGNLKVNTITPGFEPPIVTGGSVFLPKYGKYNGGKYKSCSKRTLDREGPRGCNKKSIMGNGSGVAYADTVDAAPDIVFVNGGKSTIWAYTTLYNPALVQEPVKIKVKKIKHRKWGYKVSFQVPKVLQVVAGVPITLRSLKYSIGGKKYARDYIVTTGCPRNKKYPYQATANYLYNTGERTSSTYKGTVACK
ncbi:MAG: hypothetical protein WD993_09065 [Thermoleophilaceae bacterium]